MNKSEKLEWLRKEIIARKTIRETRKRELQEAQKQGCVSATLKKLYLKYMVARKDVLSLESERMFLLDSSVTEIETDEEDL